MSDEEFASKRERQKARRAERLEKEAAQAKAADRRRFGVYGIVVVLVVALIGLLVLNQVNANRANDEQAERAAAKLDELGCTEDTRMTDLGGGHITGTEDALAAEPPEVIYPDEPPTSGRHIGQVVNSGVFDVKVDPRLTTHNMEHGYVIGWYDADTPAEDVEALKAWAEEQRGGDFDKIIVAEYYKDIPDANVAFAAWFYRQTRETFDADVAQTFLRTHYDTNGEGPERGIPSHNPGAQGVVEVLDEDVFLAGLAEQFSGAEDVTDEVEDAEPASDPDPADEATEEG